MYTFNGGDFLDSSRASISFDDFNTFNDRNSLWEHVVCMFQQYAVQFCSRHRRHLLVLVREHTHVDDDIASFDETNGYEQEDDDWFVMFVTSHMLGIYRLCLCVTPWAKHFTHLCPSNLLLPYNNRFLILYLITIASSLCFFFFDFNHGNSKFQ